ncbi:MAG: YceI family protein [Bdellovibrionales bacterium]|nr:YceI family protein [Bdellovibrionales bacterium]
MNKLSLVATTLALIANSAFAATGRVSATLRLSPAGSFVGTTNQVKSDFKKNPSRKPEAFSVTSIQVKVDDLKTSIALRDNHLHKHLNSAKNPYITATQIVFAGGKGTATIKLNGVSNKVPFTYAKTATGANFQMTLVPSTFKVEKAKYLGVGVKDEVAIEGALNY